MAAEGYTPLHVQDLVAIVDSLTGDMEALLKHYGKNMTPADRRALAAKVNAVRFITGNTRRVRKNETMN